MAAGNVTALDVGTSKVLTLVAEVDEAGEITVLGIGEVPCEGVERGLVVNLEATVTAISASLRAAEKMAGIPIRSVVTGLAGEHVRSLNSTGVIGVARRDREITREDVVRVLEAARAVAIPGDRELLHVLPRGFTVDQQSGIEDPVGMTGVRLEAEVHIVTVQATAARNLMRAIERANVAVDAVVLQCLAAAEAVLDPDERNLGAALLDIGGGTTDLAVFQKGTVRHSATIGYGGRSISHDLSIGLRTPVEQAERIKIVHGSAVASRVVQDRQIDVPGVGGREARRIDGRSVASIVEPRLTEILTMARTELEREVDLSLLAGGIVLTGGVAKTPDVALLAEKVFRLPARVGFPVSVRGVQDLAEEPRVASAIGLLRFAAHEGRAARSAPGLIGRVARPLKDWLRALGAAGAN